MRINSIAFNNQYLAMPSHNADRIKESDFETELFDTALNRLKSAYHEKDVAKMEQTIDILMDFTKKGI